MKLTTDMTRDELKAAISEALDEREARRKAESEERLNALEKAWAEIDELKKEIERLKEAEHALFDAADAYDKLNPGMFRRSP